MSLIYHATVVLAYAVAAFLAAQFLPKVMPLAIETPAVAYGAMVLAGFAILHATLAAARNRHVVFRASWALPGPRPSRSATRCGRRANRTSRRWKSARSPPRSKRSAMR